MKSDKRRENNPDGIHYVEQFSLFLRLLSGKKGGSSSVVEHQLPKLRVAGSTPVSRS